MALRDELEAWVATIEEAPLEALDPDVTLGYVVDDLYNEKDSVITTYLGYSIDDVENTVTRTYEGSELETDVQSTINKVVEW